MQRLERLTGLSAREQVPALLIGAGHAGTHWIIGTLYLLLPFIKEDLGLSYVQVGSLVTVFHLSAFLANFGSGAVVDVTGKRVLVQSVSLVLGAAALLACGWANGIAMLGFLIFVIGATNNLWHPAAISFLSELYPRTRGYALSIHAFGASLGDAVAPVAVGSMMLWLTWQGTARLSALPIFGFAVLLVLGLGRLDRAAPGPRSESVPSSYLQGVKGLISDRAVLALALMAAVRSMAQSGLLVFVPLYLANVLKVGPLLTGVGVMVMQLGGLVAGPIAGVMSDRVGRRKIVLAGLSGSTVTIVALTAWGDEVVFIAGVSVLGFMLFAVRPVIHSWMMDISPPGMAGSATSVLFGAQSAFSMLAPVLGGLIADEWGMAVVFYSLGATMLVANTMVYLMPADAAQSRAAASG